MSKSSKSCGYTGHMRIMNRVNNTKKNYQSRLAKSDNMDKPNLESHSNYTTENSKIATESRIQGKCNCSKQ